jgi:hypothetical protein
MEEARQACQLIFSSVNGLATWLEKAGCTATVKNQQIWHLAHVIPEGKQQA